MGLPRPPAAPSPCWRRIGPLACPQLRLPVRALVGRKVRAHYLAPDGRVRPAKTPGRTAVSPRLLIRMRSQVQVLAGPLPNPAGQSAAGSELGALAAGLGRAGAACPSPPAPPVTPPGPPTRASGSATTTHRGRAPSSRTAATRPVPPARAAACSRAHRAAARDGRPDTAAWPAWSLSGQARPPRPPPNPAARVRHPPPPDLRDLGSVARVPASSTIDRAVDSPAVTGASTGSGGQGRPASSTLVPNATA